MNSLNIIFHAISFISLIFIVQSNLIADENNNVCNKIWPSLEILVPMHLVNVNTTENYDPHGKERNLEWVTIFLRGFLMYWPVQESKSEITLILNDVLENTTLVQENVINVISHYKNEFKEKMPVISIKYHQHTNNTYRSGYDRQQYIFFYSDIFTTKEYIGFADTDALVHSFVDYGSIFDVETNKAIIHGKIEQLKKIDRMKRNWARATFEATGLEQPVNCMSYFPVVIKTEHFSKAREFIRHKWNTSTFEEAFHAFSDIGKESYSQFNIMCAYLFWNHRDDYQWYIHDATPWWDGFNPAPWYGQWADRAVFNESWIKPKPYIAMHIGARHRPYPSTLDLIENVLAESLLYSEMNYTLQFVANISIMGQNINTKYQTKMKERNNETLSYFIECHKFDFVDFNPSWVTNMSLILKEHEIRNNRIKECQHSILII